jgi:hypothetical protein
MTGWIITVIVVAWGANAFMDSIDHMKRSEGVYELWHVVKLGSYGVVMVAAWVAGGVNLAHALWVIPLMWVVWNLVYVAGITFGFYRWDNRWKVKWVRTVLQFKRPEDMGRPHEGWSDI